MVLSLVRAAVRRATDPRQPGSARVRPASNNQNLDAGLQFQQRGPGQGTAAISAGDPVSRLSRWREVIAKARGGSMKPGGKNMSLIGQIWPAVRGHRARLRGRRGGAYRRDARHAADAAAAERRTPPRAGAGARSRRATGADELRSRRSSTPASTAASRFVGADGVQRLCARAGCAGRAALVRAVAADRGRAPGVAQVSDGWQRASATSRSRASSFAHDELWHAVQSAAPPPC